MTEPPTHHMTFRQIRDGFISEILLLNNNPTPMDVAVAVCATLERLIAKEEAEQ